MLKVKATVVPMPIIRHLLFYTALPFFTLDAGLLARSQYSEGPATGRLDTGFSWFPVSISKC